MHVTHNESIKTLIDATRHLELEEDRIETSRPNAEVYMASSILKGDKSFKHKSYGGTRGKDSKGTKEAILEITITIRQKERHLWLIPKRTKQRSSVIIVARMVTLLVSVTSQRKYNPLKCFQEFLMSLKVPFMFLVQFI